MAVYIDDSGSHGLDAEISGVENTDWSRDATNQTFKLLTDTGSADTGFTLSSTTGWILIESYNINGNDTGTVMWRSLQAWQSDVSTSTIRNTAMTDFRTDMATIISGTNITAYDAKCTYFDGTDAHVYDADEATAFPDEASPTYTVSDYSPTSSLFTITNTLTAPEEAGLTQETSVYVSLGAVLGTPPSGTTITLITNVATGVSHDIVDEDNVDIGMSIAWTGQALTSSSSSPALSDPVDSGFLFNAQQYRTQYTNIGTGTTFTISGLNSAYTYDFEITGATTVAGRDFDFTMNGNTTTIVGLNNVDDGAIETGVTGVTSFDILMERGTGGYTYVQGLNIRRYS